MVLVLLFIKAQDKAKGGPVNWPAGGMDITQDKEKSTKVRTEYSNDR